MANEVKATPGTRKVTVGALSGAVVTIIAFALESADLQPLPPEVYAAAGTVVTALLVYMTKESYS